MTYNPKHASIILEESSPRHSQDLGIISWQNGNGSIPKIRIRIPSNTKQKLAKVINKTLPSFIVSGLNEININGLSSGASVDSRADASQFLTPPDTTLTIPNSSHQSLHHARSTISFESNGSRLSRTSQYDTASSRTSTLLNVPSGTPLTRYYSWSSNYSSLPSNNLPTRSHKLLSDKDSAFSSTIGETESAIAFLSEQECADDEYYDPVNYLPYEINIHIFKYLDIKSINSCCLVSHKWKEIAESDSIWRHKYRTSSRCWESTTDVLPSDMSWKNLYQTRHCLEQRWENGSVTPKALAGHSDGVYCVHIDNDKIVTGSRDRMIKVWDINTGKLLLTLGNARINNTNSGLRHIRSTGALNQTSSSSDPLGGISHAGSVLCIALDDKLMVSGSSDSSCIIWQLPKFKPIKQVYRHSDGVLDVCLSSDYIISCSKDTTIAVCDRHDYSLKYRLDGHRGPVNALHLNNNHLFSASGDGLVKMWNLSSGTWIRDFKANKGLACVQTSEDGKKILSGGSDCIIRIWDVETGECLQQLMGHQGLVRSLFILGHRLISGSYDQTIHIWNIENGKLITNLNGWHGSWIFSAKADCKRIVSTSFGTKPVILDFCKGLDKAYLAYIKK